jgi:drug/metabolite transporter (DMT)-like permease
MSREQIIEAVKQPLRQGLLFLYAFGINKLFEFLAVTVGFEFTPEQKVQILSYGTPIVYAILSALDRLLHKLGQAKSTKKVKSKLTLGIARF